MPVSLLGDGSHHHHQQQQQQRGGHKINTVVRALLHVAGRTTFCVLDCRAVARLTASGGQTKAVAPGAAGDGRKTASTKYFMTNDNKMLFVLPRCKIVLMRCRFVVNLPILTL